MKKLFAVFAAVILLSALAGCAQADIAGGATEPVSDENNGWGIVLSAEDVTPTGMTLVCTQSGGHYTGELQTGSPFSLEREVDGTWLPVETKTELLDWIWTMEAWMIRPDDTTKWDVNWGFLYGELEPGVYRIQKEIMDFRGPGDFTKQNYYAQFAIVE